MIKTVYVGDVKFLKKFTQHLLVAGFHLGVEIKKTDVHIDVLEHFPCNQTLLRPSWKDVDMKSQLSSLHPKKQQQPFGVY